MKKLLSLLCTLLAAALFALPAAALEEETAPALMAPAAYVVNLDTNIVVYEKESEAQLQAASLTKMMTVLLLLENYQDQLDTITVTAPGYVYDILYGKNASTADIRKGETHTLRNLLYAMLLPSGNEAAYMVADYMGGGSVDGFVAMMNAEAANIGCTGTVYTDPCGLDSGNLTTARDSYLILRALTAYDAFAEIVSKPTYDMGTNERYTTPGSYIIQNTDRLVNPSSPYYRSYTRGGKTGALGEWQNFAGWHTQDGVSYISVVLNTPNAVDEGGRPALVETASIMDWAFATYTIESALDITQPITERPVVYSTQADTVLLYPADDMMTLLPKEGGAALTEQTFHLPETLSAPIKQGDVVGTVTLTIEGELIGTADLLAGSDISRNQLLYALSRIGEFFSSTYFKVVVILTMIIAAIYIFLYVLTLLGVISHDPFAGGATRHR